MATTNNAKNKLWFDPKKPPQTPIYIGQRIPIYLVPDDTDEEERLVQPDWEKTDWVFRVVGIRRVKAEEVEKDANGKPKEDIVVDIEWPNKYIDRGVPINCMYGHFTKIPKSMIHHFTEDPDSDDDSDVEIIDLSKAKTNQEKLEQLLIMLKFLSEQRERFRQENGGAIENEENEEEAPESHEEPEEESDDEEVIVIDDTEEVEEKPEPSPTASEEEIVPTAERLRSLFPNFTEEAIQTLCKAAAQSKARKEAAAAAELEKQQVEEEVEKVEEKPAKVAKKTAAKQASRTKQPQPTKKMIAGWFRQPSKGGLKIIDLRKKARELGIAEPQKLKKPDLKREMIKRGI